MFPARGLIQKFFYLLACVSITFAGLSPHISNSHPLWDSHEAKQQLQLLLKARLILLNSIKSDEELNPSLVQLIDENKCLYSGVLLYKDNKPSFIKIERVVCDTIIKNISMVAPLTLFAVNSTQRPVYSVGDSVFAFNQN